MGRGSGGVVADGWVGGRVRRREYAPQRRSKRACPTFSAEEYAVICAAAAQHGWAVDAWVAVVALRVAHSAVMPLPGDWPEVVAELIETRDQVRRVGRLLNQLTRHANATGEVAATSARVLGMVARTVERLDLLTARAAGAARRRSRGVAADKTIRGS